MALVFKLKDLSDQMKVKINAAILTGSALTGWEDIQTGCAHRVKGKINEWEKTKVNYDLEKKKTFCCCITYCIFTKDARVSRKEADWSLVTE